jgi:hypothetical protein
MDDVQGQLVACDHGHQLAATICLERATLRVPHRDPRREESLSEVRLVGSS